jgi:hypothetical protein
LADSIAKEITWVLSQLRELKTRKGFAWEWGGLGKLI